MTVTPPEHDQPWWPLVTGSYYWLGPDAEPPLFQIPHKETPMTEEQTVDQRFHALHDQVVALAAEHPDHAYDRSTSGTCQYRQTETNPMGCIFGQALRSLGYPEVDTFDRDGGSTGIERVINGLIIRPITGAFHEAPGWQRHAMEWFQTCQTTQDGGASWSEAVARADGHLKSVTGVDIWRLHRD